MEELGAVAPDPVAAEPPVTLVDLVPANSKRVSFQLETVISVFVCSK